MAREIQITKCVEVISACIACVWQVNVTPSSLVKMFNFNPYTSVTKRNHFPDCAWSGLLN